MSSKKLSKIAGFLKYWKDAVLRIGYNKKGLLCFYISTKRGDKEIPHSWEMIANANSVQEAWEDIKNFLAYRGFSLCFEVKSERLIYSEYFGD